MISTNIYIFCSIYIMNKTKTIHLGRINVNAIHSTLYNVPVEILQQLASITMAKPSITVNIVSNDLNFNDLLQQLKVFEKYIQVYCKHVHVVLNLRNW